VLKPSKATPELGKSIIAGKHRRAALAAADTAPNLRCLNHADVIGACRCIDFESSLGRQTGQHSMLIESMHTSVQQLTVTNAQDCLPRRSH
jgi:hypothetical protein